MPLLGSQVRVAEDNTIDYLFFEKEIACKFVMMRDSAMSARVKMNTLTQEVIRRLRNTRASLDWDEFKVPILTEFCKKMARSGYPQEYRSVVIKSGGETAGSESERREAVIQTERVAKRGKKETENDPQGSLVQTSRRCWLLPTVTERRVGRQYQQGVGGGGEEDWNQDEGN